MVSEMPIISRTICATAVIVLAVALAGCGSSSSSSSSPAGGSLGSAAVSGKDVFESNCASCHTLSDAGSSGSVGPDLDDLKPDQSTVEHQVTNGGGGMPSFDGQLSAEEIAAVAAYVSSVAGNG